MRRDLLQTYLLIVIRVKPKKKILKKYFYQQWQNKGQMKSPVERQKPWEQPCTGEDRRLSKNSI